jgi:hypothetical protein
MAAWKGGLGGGPQTGGMSEKNEADNMLKTKRDKPPFSQNKAENILKIRQLI